MVSQTEGDDSFVRRISRRKCCPVSAQYVITLAGVLEFTTVGGETFTIHPGEVLVAEDTSGSGHKWRLVNDEPWKRAYVVFKQGADTHFVPDPA
jgi:quercetin dioxygenase-like cupin family protein